MKKVLFLVKAREFGGLEIVLLDWLSGIEYSKVSVAICCYGTDALRERLASSGLPVESIQLTISDADPFWKIFLRWMGLFSSIRPDKVVILESVVSEFDVIPAMTARLSNRGRVFLFEASWGRSTGSPSTEKRKLHYGFLPGIKLYRYKEIFRQRLRAQLAHHTFVASQGIKDKLIVNYGYPSRVSVLHHGVDTIRFQPSFAERVEFRRAHEIPENATVIVSHGRLVPTKRVDRILKAFKVLSTEHENVWLLLTCYGPLKEEIETMVATSGAYRRVKLVGFQTDSSRLLKASDTYVLSSNDEGFGIALVEALSTGLVCVATNGSGPRDIIADRQNGFLVEATDEGVLHGLRRAMSLTPAEREQFVQRGRKTVEARFDIRRAVQSALEAMEIPHQ